MHLLDNPLYREDIKKVGSLPLPWEKLCGRSLLLSGATGLVGSFLVDTILSKNVEGLDCTVYALGRSEAKAAARFEKWAENKYYCFLPYDVNLPFVREDLGTVDYVLHLASNTHPMQYATDPIGTITTNIIGLNHMLEFAVAHSAGRFAFTSSNEIYGENRGDVELFREDYCGHINSNTMRAGYPESKRCGEALCQAYMAQKGLDVVIPRPTRSYGPTMQMSDTKAISQFIKKAVSGENIVLKSAGTQNYSFAYMADTVSGLLTVLLRGERGEAYNIADEASNITLRDLAGILARCAGTEVCYEIPDAVEASGYSKATKALLDGSKLKALGWKPLYSIETGLPRTVEILKDLTAELTKLA